MMRVLSAEDVLLRTEQGARAVVTRRLAQMAAGVVVQSGAVLDGGVPAAMHECLLRVPGGWLRLRVTAELLRDDAEPAPLPAAVRA